MDSTTEQQAIRMIEPLYHRRRRIRAIVVILIVIIGFMVSIFTQPPFDAQQQSAVITPQPQQGNTQGLPGDQQDPQNPQEHEGNLARGLLWVGQIIISFIAVLSSIVELTGVNVRDLFSTASAKTNVEEFPFLVFQDFDKLLAYLFPDPQTPLLSDRDIKYLPQISAEADAVFQSKGMVLIRGISKTGKTREACEMLRRWWYTGPTVLVVRSHVGLYPPFKIPENLPLRNLVIFFDDMDRYLSESSSLRRLDETLQFFQEICHDRGELRVVATARQEEEFWEKLKFDESQTPWSKFALIQLYSLSAEKALEIINELSKTSGIIVNQDLAKRLAEKNNGTFLNLVLAFRSWLSQDIKTITADELKAFEGTLKNTWRRRYEELTAAHPRVRPVYAAIDFMQSHNISLRPELISELSAEMGMNKALLSILGWMDRLRNWFDISSKFNWYRDKKRRYQGWLLISMGGLSILYIFSFLFFTFIPGDAQVHFFDRVFGLLLIICLTSAWILLIFFILINVLQNFMFRRTNKILRFLMQAEIPVRDPELRPYENQFEGNGSTNNWDIKNYAGEIQDKKFVSNVSQRIINRYLMLAEQLRLNGEFSSASKFAILAQKISPRSPIPAFMLGKINLDEGKMQNAIGLISTDLEFYDRSNIVAFAYERLALSYLYLGEFDKAEHLAVKALNEMSDLVTATWILVITQLKQGKENNQLPKLLKQFIPVEIQKVLKVVSAGDEKWFGVIQSSSSSFNSRKTLNSRMTFSKGAILLSFACIFSLVLVVLAAFVSSRFVQAESGLQISNALLTIFPKSPYLYYQRGERHHMLGDHEEALADYTEAIHIDPDYAYAYYSRGVVYDSLADYKKALVDYAEAIRINPDYAYAYNNRGLVYYNLREYEKALADYNKAIRINPDYTYAYNNRGLVYYSLREYEKALDDYAEAIRIYPEYAYAYNNRGNTYYDLKDYKKALADYTEAIRIDPKYAHAYDGRANTYYMQQDYKKALADYTEAIRIDPKYAYAYNWRGNTYYYLKDYKKALADYTEAIRIDPKYADAYDGRGNTYFVLRDYKKALADYTEAIRINPKYAYAFYGRGIVYQALGMQVEAEADFQKYRELSGQS
jgi:tetratricopeptide (TPR) repeat protein